MAIEAPEPIMPDPEVTVMASPEYLGDQPSGTVRYVGMATIREISAEDWRSVGAEGQRPARWQEENRWELDLKHFSKEAIEYMKNENGFQVKP